MPERSGCSGSKGGVAFSHETSTDWPRLFARVRPTGARASFGVVPGPIHDALVPLPLGVGKRAVDDDLAHPDAVGVDGVDLVRPVGPVGERVRVRGPVPDPDRRVAPVDDRARVARLDDAHVRVAALLVRHRLGAADHAGREGLDELVVVPDAVLGHPVRDVARAVPEREPEGRLVEAHDHVGKVGDAPRGVPALVVAQPRVEGAEAGRARGQPRERSRLERWSPAGFLCAYSAAMSAAVRATGVIRSSSRMPSSRMRVGCCRPCPTGALCSISYALRPIHTSERLACTKGPCRPRPPPAGRSRTASRPSPPRRPRPGTPTAAAEGAKHSRERAAARPRRLRSGLARGRPRRGRSRPTRRPAAAAAGRR